MRKQMQSKLIKTLIWMLIGTGWVFAENSFTLSGTNIVTNYWNSTNDGGQVKAQSFEANIAQYKTYIRVDGGAYVQIAGAFGGAATFGQLDFSLSAADIENTDPLSDNETFDIYVEFLDGSAVPVDTVRCTSSSITVDQTTPVINSVTSSSDDGDYAIDATINVQVNFSENVSLSGGNSLQVTLETGTPDETLSISTLSNSSTASETYTVQSGNASSDLTVNSIGLSGGTLRDQAGNDADLSIPGGNNLDDNSAIVVDGVVPNVINLAGGAGTVVTSGGNVNADYWNSSNTELKVTAPIPNDASLLGGEIQVKGYWGGVGGAQDLGTPATIAAIDEDKTITIAAAVLEAFPSYAEGSTLKIVVCVTDKAGNESTLGTESDDEITIDETVPTVSSLTSSTADGYLNLSSPAANITVTFSESVTLATDDLDIELETGDTDQTVSISPFASSSTASASYTVQSGDESSDLTANSLTLAGGATLRDVAGNDANLSIPGGSNLADNSDLVVDGVTATILSVTSTTADGAYPIDSEINVTVTFSEALTLSGGNTLDVSLDAGQTVSISSFTSQSVVSGTYTVQTTDASSDLAASGVAKSGGTLTDDAGNEADLSSIPTNISDGSAIEVDGVVPSTVNLAAGAGTAAASGGTAQSGYWNNTNTSLDVNVPIAAGEGLLGGTVEVLGYWGASSAGAVSLQTETIEVQGSDQQVEIPENTLENFGGFIETGVLKLVATVTDPAGNTSTVGTESDDEITIDQTAPTISSLTSTTNDGYLNLSSPATNVTVTFSEAVTLATDDLEIELETGTTDRTVSISPFASSATASGNYTVQSGDLSDDLSANSANLAGGATLRDAAGNDADLSLPANSNLDDNSDLVVDGVTATILSVTSTTADGSYGIGDEINVTVTFSEDLTLTGGQTLDVTLDAGRSISIDAFTSTDVVSGTYTVVSTDVSSDLSATGVAKSGGNLTDAAGNEADLSSIPTNIDDGSAIVVDGVAPSAVNMSGGSVVASGGTVVADYWNSTNTFLDVTVPIAAGEGLLDGTIQLQGYWGATSAGAVDLGLPVTITVQGADQLVQIPANTLENFGGFAEDEVLKIIAFVTDPAGNTSAEGDASSNEITIDQTAPTVSSLTSTTNDGYLNLSSAPANVTVNFSEIVTLAGNNLEIELETGTTDRTVSITPFASSTSGSGTYSVQTGDLSDDLSANSASLAGGATLRDAAGNDANLSIPGTSNLDDNSALVVDGVIATIVSITSTTADGSYAIGDEVNVTVTFSEALTLSGGNTLDVTLDAGRTINIESFTSTDVVTGTYTIEANDESSDLEATGVAKSAGTLTDDAGNEADLSSIGTNIDVGSDIVIDGVVPSTVNLAAGAGAVIAAGGTVVSGYWNSTNTQLEVDVPIAAGEGLIGGEVQVKGYWGATSAGAQNLGDPATIVVEGADQTVAIAASSLESFGGYAETGVLKLVVVVTDPAGNTSTIGTESDDEITIDETAPTVSSLSSTTNDGYLNLTSAAANITVNFSEAVTLANGNLLVELETGTTDRTVTISAFGPSLSAAGSYSVQTGDLSNDLTANGPLTLSTPTTSLRDNAGNDATLTIQGGTNLGDNSDLVVDGVEPTIQSITSSSADDYYKIDDQISVTILFSENVTLSGGNNLLINLDAGQAVTISSIDNTNEASGTYTVVALDESADLTATTVAKDGGTLTDASGNEVDLTTIPTNIDDGSDIVVDGIVPTDFTVGSVVSVGDPVVVGYWNSANTEITVEVPVANDASLTGGTIQVQGFYGNISGAANIGSAQNIALNDLGGTYTIDLSANAIAQNVGFSENQTLKITAVITDVAGNATTGTESADDFIVDETVPTISSITSVPTAGTFKETDQIDITLNFSENVYLVDGDLETTLETGDVLTSVIADLNGVSSVTETYTVGEDDASNDLTVNSVDLTAGTLRDIAGNDATLGAPQAGTNLSDNSNLVIDGAIPTITQIKASGDDGAYFGIGDTVTITAMFSENVSISAGNNLQVTLDVGQVVSLSDFTDVDSAFGYYVVQEGQNSDFLTATSVALDGGTLVDGAGNSVPMDLTASINIDDEKILYIDGAYPDFFTTGNILTIGEPVVTGYWNTQNTGLEVILPVTGLDESLDGGTAHLEARMDANTFAAIGDTLPVETNPVTMSLSRAELEADLAGYFAGQVIEVRGVLTDIAGNSREGFSSVVTLTNDQTAPTQTVTSALISSGESAIQGYFNLTDTLLTVQTPLEADNTLIAGTFQLQGRIGVAGAWNDIGSDSTIQTVNTTMESIIEPWSTLETWGANDADDLFFRAIVTDQAGNETTGATGDLSIRVDRTPPGAFVVGDVQATGGTIVSSYFNSTNLGATVTVPISQFAADLTLAGGYVQLRSVTETDTSNFLDSLDIVDTNDLIFTPTRAQLEGLGFAEDDTLKFDAIITDVAGNSTTGSISAQYLIIDEVLPVVNEPAVVEIQGSNLSPEYWNSTSNGILFKVEIDNLGDPSLQGGELSIAADLSPSGNTVFETFATTQSIASLGSDTVTVTIPGTEIEALEEGTGFADGLEIQFQVSISDRAGNSATSTTIATTLTIDQTAPTGGDFVAAGTTIDPFINDLDTLKAEWSGFNDPVSDLAYYEYSVGGSGGDADIVPWTETDTTLMDTLYAYLHEAEYFINVRAIDSAGNISLPIYTDLIVADLALPSTTTDILSYYYIDDWDEEYSFGGTAVDALSGPDSITMQLIRNSDAYNWDGTTWVEEEVFLRDKLGDANWFTVLPTTRVLPGNGWGFYMPADSLGNREDYTVSLFALDSAGNWQSSPDEHTFQFVINTPPEFADMDDTLRVDEDVLFDYTMVATDVDLGTISGDTLFHTILEGPDSLKIDLRTGVFDWTPENADVGQYDITMRVYDTFDESDTTSFVLVVNQVNDAPEPVTLLLPADSTELTAQNGLELTFSWTKAFDIEGDTATYAIFWEGKDGYDTTIATADTFYTVRVDSMDFPTVDPIQWFVRALDATDTSLPSDTFHVTTSPPTVASSTELINAQMRRYTAMDTSLVLSNSGLTNLRWTELSSPAWIDLDTTGGVIEFGDSADFEFTIDLGGRTVGSYVDSILLSTNDPDQDTVSIQVFVKAFDIPRPVVAFYKNAAYPGVYDLMIVDSLGMADSIAVEFADSNMTITEIDTFSYMTSIELSSDGLKNFEVFASNWVGDTTVTAGLTASLARTGVPWIAESPDQLFRVTGSANSLIGNTQVVILDSMLSSRSDSRYRVLGDGTQLAKPIMVSMPMEEKDQAIYALIGNGYQELPSIAKGDRAYAWSAGFGAYKLGPKNIVVPEKSVLAQNYPNPFNPSTTIEYDIGFQDGLSQQVVFEVYNIRGQVVRTLVDQRMEPGRYSIVWNALDNYGRQVSSGIYLARLMTDGGYMKTVKMLVLR